MSDEKRAKYPPPIGSGEDHFDELPADTVIWTHGDGRQEHVSRDECRRRAEAKKREDEAKRAIKSP